MVLYVIGKLFVMSKSQSAVSHICYSKTKTATNHLQSFSDGQTWTRSIRQMPKPTVPISAPVSPPKGRALIKVPLQRMWMLLYHQSKSRSVDERDLLFFPVFSPSLPLSHDKYNSIPTAVTVKNGSGQTGFYTCSFVVGRS